MKLRLLNPKFATIVVALAVLSSGCAHLGRASVGVTNLTADVVFGVKEKPAAAASPANFPSSSFTVNDVPPPADTTPTTKKPFPFTNIKPAASCPAATVRDAPKTVSETKVTTERPAVGDYRWKRTGEITPANSKIGVSVSGFEQRQILKLAENSPDPQNGFVDVRYTTSQIKLNEPNITVITDWRVRRLNGDDPPVSSVRGNRLPEPAFQSGVYITRIENKNRATGKSTTFQPGGAGVKYLPLPVDVGLTIDSTGVDPSTFDTFQNKGKVTKKEFVDACGELIDAYRVEATQTFTSGGDTVSLTYNYDMATSLGGLLVLEEIKAPLKNGSNLNTRNNIGQVQPTPASAP